MDKSGKTIRPQPRLVQHAVTRQIAGVAGSKRAAVSREAHAGPLALTRVLQILKLLGEEEDGCTMAELSRLLDAPRSSTFALLQPMTSQGYLARSGTRYRLGAAAFDLASGILRSRDDDQIIQGAMSDLAHGTGQTITCSELVLEEGVLVHRHVHPGRGSIRYVVDVGARRSLHDTAAGRVLLAHADPQWLADYLKTLRLGGSARANAAELRRIKEHISSAQQLGYSTSFGEYDPAVGAFAAPILDANRRATRTINVTGPVRDVVAAQAAILRLIMLTSRRLSKALMPRPATPER